MHPLAAAQIPFKLIFSSPLSLTVQTVLTGMERREFQSAKVVEKRRFDSAELLIPPGRECLIEATPEVNDSINDSTL